MRFSTLKRTLLIGATAAGLALAAPVADAAPTKEAAKLMKTRKAKRYRVKTKHSSIKAGAARVHIKAPASVVRKVVTDYRRYDKFMPRFEKSRVVGRKGKTTDVYLQVPILKGAAKIWAIVRFGAPEKKNGVEVIRGKLVKGNVKRLDAVWRIQEIDKANTQLNLEMLIVPKLPVPGSLVTDEVAFAADKAVTGSRDRAEKKSKARKVARR